METRRKRNEFELQINPADQTPEGIPYREQNCGRKSFITACKPFLSLFLFPSWRRSLCLDAHHNTPQPSAVGFDEGDQTKWIFYARLGKRKFTAHDRYCITSWRIPAAKVSPRHAARPHWTFFYIKAGGGDFYSGSTSRRPSYIRWHSIDDLKKSLGEPFRAMRYGLV